MTQRQKILIVDDAPINIQVLNEALQRDYHTFFATSGRDALRIAAEVVPDLVLLDVMMPEMDGYEVCRAMKANAELRDIPVVFVTAMSQQEDETVGLELGAVDYITKPFNPVIVRLRVRNQLELKRQRDMLARLSLLDGLTGIPNRRAFDDYYQREWKRALRCKRELSILLVDIDYFKGYNDAYGHLAGDDCLRRLSVGLSASLSRPADFMARYGGEEFIGVLPETDCCGALVIAEEMRCKVEALGIPHVSSPLSQLVTVSVGVASMVPERGVDAAELISIADKALYRAKSEGRNRVVCEEMSSANGHAGGAD